ncbi:hypothetical protein AMTRI_Chr12g233930 [Amborella trichopoda]
MVPVYACESLLSLWNPSISIECDILRNCYEAFALYCFGSYLVACLGGEERVIELLEVESRKQLTKPLLEDEGKNIAAKVPRFHDFFIGPSKLGKRLYSIVKFGIVQYMILKTQCAFLALLLELFGVYGDGKVKYPYIVVVINFSQTWALYCLVQFYNFVSFKAIVFATWWQGLGIAILCSLGILQKQGRFQSGPQDFLICIEMAIAEIAHFYVFSAEPYRFLPVSEHGKVTTPATKATFKLEEEGEQEPALVEQTETYVKAPGTSITESVQDVVIGGGEHVRKDVVLTITQAIELVEKGVTKIQETFHHISIGSGDEEVKVDKHVSENVTKDRSHVLSSEKPVRAESSEKSSGALDLDEKS